MTIQNIFYICGITVFILASFLMLILISGTLKTSKKVRELIKTFEDTLESNVVSTIIQMVPLLAAIFTEITDRRPTRKKRKKRK